MTTADTASSEPVANAMNGLQQLQTLFSQDKRLGIAESMDFRLVELEIGRSVFEGTPGVHVYNPIGVVHGGYAATLLDSACGCAVHSRLDANQTYTTLELKLAYHKAITRGTGAVRAEGRVVTMGRRVAFAEAKLTDASGRLYASATSTLLVIDK